MSATFDVIIRYLNILLIEVKIFQCFLECTITFTQLFSCLHAKSFKIHYLTRKGEVATTSKRVT